MIAEFTEENSLHRIHHKRMMQTRAVKHGVTWATTLLLSLNAPVNARNLCGQTPLHLACHMLREEMVRDLLEVPNVDVDLGDNYGNAPIHLACMVRFYVLQVHVRVRVVAFEWPSV